MNNQEVDHYDHDHEQRRITRFKTLLDKVHNNFYSSSIEKSNTRRHKAIAIPLEDFKTMIDILNSMTYKDIK